MREFIIIFSFLFCSLLWGQEEITIGEKYNFYSQKLKEKREYWVYTPNGYYSSKEKYPVIYVLDGDPNFYTTVAIQKALTKGMYNYMPESIIVGVLNTDRTRDLTPTQSTLQRDGKIFFENSGGAENFYHFLVEELKQDIEKKYRTNGYSILVGHSFGGLFTLSTLLNHPASFNSYIALDPSIWWDNKKIYKDAIELWDKQNYKGVTLFIAMAKEEITGNNEHSEAIKLFCTDLLAITNFQVNNQIRSSWKYYPEDDHGTIIMPGIYDAFKFIFKGITLPVKKIPQNPNLIGEYYAHLSEQLNYTFYPSETLISNLTEYALSIDEIDAAFKIIEYNLKNYPESKRTKDIHKKIQEKDHAK